MNRSSALLILVVLAAAGAAPAQDPPRRILRLPPAAADRAAGLDAGAEGSREAAEPGASDLSHAPGLPDPAIVAAESETRRGELALEAKEAGRIIERHTRPRTSLVVAGIVALFALGMLLLLYLRTLRDRAL